MSNLTKIINIWKAGVSPDSNYNYKSLFNELLHKEPYYLKYSIDSKFDESKDLLLIYPTDKSDRDSLVVQECNGIVIHKESLVVVAYGMNLIKDAQPPPVVYPFPWTMEESSLKNVVVEEMVDGTVIKIFYWNGTWIVSTNKKLNSKFAYWQSNRSFYDLFCDAIPHYPRSIQDVFNSDLDKCCTYTFILLHPENRLVIHYNKPTVVHVSTRNNVTFEEYECGIGSKFIWATYIDKVSTDVDLLRVNNKMWDINTPYDPELKRGIMVTNFSDPYFVTRIKKDYPWFDTANKLRKNLPSIYLSYLACNRLERNSFKQFFGNTDIFRYVDIMDKLPNFIFEHYIMIYVKKRFHIHYFKDYYPQISNVLYRVHGRYIKGNFIPIKEEDVSIVLDFLKLHEKDALLSEYHNILRQKMIL